LYFRNDLTEQKRAQKQPFFPHQTYLKDKIMNIFVIFIKQTSSKSERNVFLVVYFGAF